MSDPFSLLDNAVLEHLGEKLRYSDSAGLNKELSVVRVFEDEINNLRSTGGTVRQRVRSGPQFEVLTDSLPNSFDGCVFTVSGEPYQCADLFEIDEAWSLMTLAPKQNSQGGSNGSWIRGEN